MYLRDDELIALIRHNSDQADRAASRKEYGEAAERQERAKQFDDAYRDRTLVYSTTHTAPGARDE